MNFKAKIQGALAACIAVVLAAAPVSALVLGANLIRFDNQTVLTAAQAGSLASTTAITAATTQTQAAATQLNPGFSNVTTCATASDGVKLPPAIAGRVCTVRNSGAAALRVWPTVGDAIASLAVNLSVDIPVKGQLTFRAIDGTTWKLDEKLTLQSPTTQTGSLVIAAAANAGNTVTTITNASQAAARTYTIPDAGANASFLMSAGALAPSGVITPTGGIAAAGGFSASPRLVHTGGNPATAAADGTNLSVVVTELYVSEIFVPCNMSVTGVSAFFGDATEGSGATGTKAMIFNSAGTRLAITPDIDVSGITTDSYGALAFSSPLAVLGPATYYIGIISGVNTNRLNTHVVGAFGAGKVTGLVYATEAGYATITPPTTFTTGLGPIASLY